VAQCRTQYFQAPGKRGEENFLSQYDPLEVLGLSPECTDPKEVERSFIMLQKHFGPQGPHPNEEAFLKVQRAYDILKDVNSPYYMKASVQDSHRRKLQLGMMPPWYRRGLLVHFTLTCIFIAIVFAIFMKLMFQPMNKQMRAALR
jgi:preprotein translocase subunit Sec63